MLRSAQRTSRRKSPTGAERRALSESRLVRREHCATAIHRQLIEPGDSRPDNRGCPQAAHSRRDQPRSSDASVELAAQQIELHPTGEARRCCETRRADLSIEAEHTRKDQRKQVPEYGREYHSHDCEAKRGLGVAHGVKRRRVQTTHGRREKANGRADENLPDPDRVAALESAA